jgi:HK97 family phage portal protein
VGTLADWLTQSLASSRPSTQLEVRAAPHALPSPIQMSVPGQGQIPDWDGVQAINSAYHGNLYVYRCLEATANAIAGLPFRAGTDPEKKLSFSGPQYSRLAYLLSPPPGSPNPQWTPRQVWKYAVIQYLATGKWVWLKEYTPGGRLIGLWPLPSQYVTPVPANPRSGGDKYFSGFNYRVQGKVAYFPEDKVFYAWNPSQADHLQPESVLKAASYRIGLAQMLDRYDHALMKNNAVPTTIVTTEPFATKEDRREFRQQFISTFGGYDNAGKTIFGEADPDYGEDGSTHNDVKSKISVERLGMTATEMQQNEKYAQVVNDIHIALGTPKSVLGVATEETYANGAQELTNWWNERLLPLAQELTDHVNIRLAPELGHHVGWFDTSKVKALQPAQKFSAAEISALIKPDATNDGPIMDRDEARAELGLPPWTEEQQKAYEEAQEAKLKQQQEQFESQQKLTPQGIPVAGGPKPPVAQGKPNLAVVKPVAKPNKAPVKALVARQVANYLLEQRNSLEQRQNSRKGRKIGSLEGLLDLNWETLRAAEVVGPVLRFLGLPESCIAEHARRLAEDTRCRLLAADTLSEAYEDLSTRAAAMAEHCVSDAEPVPLDHIQVLLRAVEAEKLTSADAYTKFLEVS